ncbi:MAG: YjbE family putative metal transport protein, partial [Pseudomonadota bacterium]
RRKAIIIGIVAATVMRIGFALITTQLLAITGLLLAGGILLLWVCWKMYQELRVPETERMAAAEVVTGTDINLDGTIGGPPANTKTKTKTKTLGQAITQIIIADVTMSLDNVLAVAGAAHKEPVILVFGLVLSIALMGAVSVYIASLLNRHRWIAWVGLLVILGVALKMCYEGSSDLVQYGLPGISS